MSKKLGVLFLVFAFLLSNLSNMPVNVFAQEVGTTAQNPIIWADVPDVDIIRVGNAYYMTSTTMHMHPGVPIMKSTDLVNWKIVNYVYDILGAEDKQALINGQNEYGKGSWASSFKYHDGKFYVVFGDIGAGKTYIYQTTDIEKGPWTKSVLNTYYHDMSLFFDDDGRVYLVYGNGAIKAIELTSDVTAVKPGGFNQTLIANANAPTGSNIMLTAEGTHVQKINGKYYIFNINWPSGGVRTEIVHRSDTFTGTYEGKVFLANPGAGVAQGQLIDTPDGKWYALLFQDHGSVGRVPFLVPTTWSADGWPVASTNVTDTGISAATSPNFNIVQSDEFNNSPNLLNSYHEVVQEKTPVIVTPSLLDPSAAPESIVNPGVENGAAPWINYGNCTVSASITEHNNGAGSLFVTGRKGSTDGPKQDLTGKVVAGHTYYFSASVKYTGDTAIIGTKQFNFNVMFNSTQSQPWLSIKVLKSANMTKGTWGTISGTYTVPEGTSIDKPFVFLETAFTSTPTANDLMDFYLDDVSWKDLTPDGNIVINGGIENGVTHWTGNDNAVVSVSNTEYSSGTNSLFITGRKATGDGPKQDLTGKVLAGHTYSISANVKYIGDSYPTTKQFNFDIEFNSTQPQPWTSIKILKSAMITKGAWGTIFGTYEVPVGTSIDKPFLFIETPWVSAPSATNDLMDFYVDDIVIKDVTPTDTMKAVENESNGSNLNLVWQWNHNPDNTKWSLTDRTGYLRLTTGRLSAGINEAKNTLTQRTFGPECSGNVAIDVSKMKDGDYAGLAAFQNTYGFVGVKMAGTTKSIVMVKGVSDADGSTAASGPTEVQAAQLPSGQTRVYLKVDFDFKNNTDKAYFYYSLDGNTWTKIGDYVQMTYSLKHFMGYRFGLFNYATKSIGGYVDFDYFRVEPKMTGTTATTLLNASMADVSSVLGVPNTEILVPLNMDALPEGQYSSISASINIPKYLTVSGVDFNAANITGTPSYTLVNDQLHLNVTGTKVNFANKNSDKLFAAIKLKVINYVPANTTVQINADYIKADNGSISYEVSKTTANIGLKAIDMSGVVVKKPGYNNPLMDYKLGADPYAITYNGKVYVYLSSDEYEYNTDGTIKSNSFSKLNKVFVLSSSDMVNWTDEGAIPVAGAYGLNDGKGIAKWASNSWAPATTHKVIDGKDKFFLYFANGAGGIGVLTADSPIGPWTDPLGKALVTSSTPGMSGVVWLFDPAVLVDDDGTGYLYCGGGIPYNPTDDQIAHPKTARVLKLGDDMISLASDAQMIDAPYLFEDSGIHKYNGKYYYSYCINFSGTHPSDYPAGEIGYMISDNPMGPFTYVGHFLKNPGAFFADGGNNHHTVFNFNNQWYVIYHAQTVAQAATGKGNGYRSPHINKIEYTAAGMIKEVKADFEGVPQIQNLNPYERTEGETIAWHKGLTTEITTATGGRPTNLHLTSINNGDWLAVSNADFGEKGATGFKANIASAVGGKIEIHLDSPTGTTIGTLNVGSTGGEQTWKVMETKIDKVTGVHSIFFVFIGEGNNNLFNIDYWQFTDDITPPHSTINLEGTLGDDNWYKSDVKITLFSEDNPGDSGIAKIEYSFDGLSWSLYEEPFTINTEGITKLYYKASDNAGNEEVASTIEIKIDKSAPVVELVGFENGSKVVLDSNTTVNWLGSDQISGLASDSSGKVSLDTSFVGKHTKIITAADKAGNINNYELTYYVIYEYSGILQPIDAAGSSDFKAGSTIPVKFSLIDGKGKCISTALAKLYISRIGDDGTTGDEVAAISSGSSNTDNQFRYDNTSQQYIFNLSTKKLNLVKGNYQITIKLDDEQTYTARFLLK